MKTNFNIGFCCKQVKANKNGYASIEMCIAYQGKRFSITLPRKETPEGFKKAMTSPKVNQTKTFCNTFAARVQAYMSEMLDNGETISIDILREYIQNGGKKVIMLSQVVEEFMAHKDMTYRVKCRYTLVMNLVLKEIGDIDVTRVTVGQINDLVRIIKAKYMPETARGYLIRVKAMFQFALDHAYIKANPMAETKIKKPKANMEYLTEDEVKKLQRKDFGIERLNQVRDVFLFMCYTGMSYSDCSTFSKADIKQSELGPYVSRQRQKTDITYTFLLLPDAVKILEKYDYQLPIISNQKSNAFLKEIGLLAGIKKNLHCHLARHTAATLLLNRGVPMEVVSHVLGHSSIKITESVYAKMLDTTVLAAMAKLR